MFYNYSFFFRVKIVMKNGFYILNRGVTKIVFREGGHFSSSFFDNYFYEIRYFKISLLII